MILTLTETRPKDSGGGGGLSRDEIVQEKARDVRSKLPIDYNMTDVRETVKKLAGPKGLNDKGMTVPQNVFLFQELTRF
jgi:dynein heavy chain